MCDRYDELLVGEGNSSSFWRANDPSGVIEKRTGSCTRRLQVHLLVFLRLWDDSMR